MTKRTKQTFFDMFSITMVLLGILGSLNSWELGNIGFAQMLLQIFAVAILARAVYLLVFKPAHKVRRTRQPMHKRYMPAQQPAMRRAA